MVVASDVSWWGAPGVREAVPIAVLGMVGVSGATLKGVVGRVLREVQTTARPMVVGSAAVGMEGARSLLGEGAGCVPHMVMLLQLRLLQVEE